MLVVRKGNPKGIKDWDDLIKPGIKVITPNPKTSGGARWNYLAAWEYAKRKYGSQSNGDSKAKEFVAKLYGNVTVLDTGARGSAITFGQRAQGDVLIAWENEAYLLEKEFGTKFDVVAPSLSILAEPALAVIDKNVDKKAPALWLRSTSSICIQKKARTLPAKTSTVRQCLKKPKPSTPNSLPSSTCSASTALLVAGPKPTKITLLITLLSTRSTQENRPFDSTISRVEI